LRKIAVVGLGGTGSYILDLVAKTPVTEIHIIDGDDFLSHNAFRAPGAAAVEQLRERPKKVGYFATVYSLMRRGIVPHPCYLDGSNLALLAEMDFVFLSLVASPDRDAAIAYLLSKNIPFVDVGMGVYEAEEALGGLLRTTSDADRSWRAGSRSVAERPARGEGPYDRNIQIADLNALNAALAVVKWKKMFGFYLDFENETSAIYQIDSNVMIHEERD
jgi:hypothetical protein